MDIVLSNSKEMLAMAKKLDISNLIFVDGNLGIFNDEKLFSILKSPKRSEMHKSVDVVYNLEDDGKKDFIHHRNSGLNHILAKILSEKDIIVAFNFNLFLKGKSTVLDRMKQNVRLYKKYKVKTVVASFASSPYELRSLEDLKTFGKVIGMNGKELKKGYLEERAKYNRKKKAGLVANGIEVLD